MFDVDVEICSLCGNAGLVIVSMEARALIELVLAQPVSTGSGKASRSGAGMLRSGIEREQCCAQVRCGRTRGLFGLRGVLRIPELKR